MHSWGRGALNHGKSDLSAVKKGGCNSPDIPSMNLLKLHKSVKLLGDCKEGVSPKIVKKGRMERKSEALDFEVERKRLQT